jgi:HD-like signal output (HDOD) protein
MLAVIISASQRSESEVSRVVTGTESASEAFRRKALQALHSLPPFSPILSRLLASLAEEDVSFAKLADLVEKDTVVAGNLLHLVNSAAYARRGTVSSVRHALSVLGTNKLRNAVLGMSVARMWNNTRMPATWSMARFNLHSAAVAILCDLIVQRVSAQCPEGAFTAGLLHDTGRLLIAMGLPAEHDQIAALQDRELISLVECEQRVLGFTHPDLSARALRFWNLPEPIQAAAAGHHPAAAPHSPGENTELAALQRSLAAGGKLPLASVVAAANQFVNSTGVSIASVPGSPCGDPANLAALGLEATVQDGLLAEFKGEFDAMSPFFR